MKNTISDSCIPLILCAAVLTVGLAVAEQFVEARSEVPLTVHIEANASTPGLTPPDRPLAHADTSGSAPGVPMPTAAQEGLLSQFCEPHRLHLWGPGMRPASAGGFMRPQQPTAGADGTCQPLAAHPALPLP
jgi:hypothetical protein